MLQGCPVSQKFSRYKDSGYDWVCPVCLEALVWHLYNKLLPPWVALIMDCKFISPLIKHPVSETIPDILVNYQECGGQPQCHKNSSDLTTASTEHHSLTVSITHSRILL